MTGDELAPPPGDLLVQAVEGMERPLFVLDDDWRFRYVNPAGARVLDRTVEQIVGRGIWVEFPEAVGGPFEELYRRVRDTGVAGSTEAWFEPLGKWFEADAFLTDAGLVVTYDDVTERRRTEEERAAAVAAREEAVARFAGLVVPALADWCLVSVVGPDGTRRDVGRAHRDPALTQAMHRYADLRVATNLSTAPVPRLLRSQQPVIIPDFTPEHAAAMVAGAEALAALEPLRPAAVAAFPLIARGEVFGALTLVNGPERGAHTEAELRTAEIASRRAALALDNARLAVANQQV